jgi:hypothetical protein
MFLFLFLFFGENKDNLCCIILTQIDGLVHNKLEVPQHMLIQILLIYY